MAVADGAGSAPRSGDGSATAVKASTECLTVSLQHLLEYPDSSLMDALKGAVFAARTALQEMAASDDADSVCTIDDLATTLLLVVIGSEWIGIAQIGDGAIAARNSDGSVSVLTVSGGNEYLNETAFITSRDYVQRMHLRVIPAVGVDGVAVMSDGLQLLAINYKDNTAHAPFFHPLFQFAAGVNSSDEELNSFLASDRVCARTDDDKTIVIAVRNNGAVLP